MYLEDRVKIKTMLMETGLTNKWLLSRLEKREIMTEKTEISAAINGLRKGPKVKRILEACVSELENYKEKIS